MLKHGSFLPQIFEGVKTILSYCYYLLNHDKKYMNMKKKSFSEACKSAKIPLNEIKKSTTFFNSRILANQDKRLGF